MDIRKAIPAKCFKKDTFRSLSYLARDVVVVAGLAAGALAIKNPLLWPAYWAAQGTMFWALFVVGHDCGHGSFSDNKLVNNVVGKFMMRHSQGLRTKIGLRSEALSASIGM